MDVVVEPRSLIRVGAAAVLLLLPAVTSMPPAAAGGSVFYPVEDRYEPGEVATVIGFISGADLADRGSAGDGGPSTAAVATGSSAGGSDGGTAFLGVAAVGGLTCVIGAVLARFRPRRAGGGREAPCE